MDSGTYFQSGIGGSSSGGSTNYAIYQYDSFNDYGSTNTKIRKWLNLTYSSDTSSLLTVVNDASNGFSVTINRNCVISIMYTEDSTAQDVGVSKNSNQLTTNMNAINAINRLAMGTVVAADNTICVSITDMAIINDVYRCHAAGAVIGGASVTRSGVYVMAKEA